MKNIQNMLLGNQYVRNLDIDDLIILASLLDNTKPLSSIAKGLRLTPPALSHRLNKYRDFIPNFRIEANSSSRQCSPEAKEFCIKAKLALDVLGIMEEKKIA